MVADSQSRRGTVVVLPPLTRSLLSGDAETSAECTKSAFRGVAYHWPARGAKHHLRVRYDSFGWKWSGELRLVAGEEYLRIRNEHTHESRVLRADVHVDNATIRVVFQHCDTAPFYLRNHTLETLRFFQEGTGDVDVLLPYSEVSYAWSEPTGTKKLELEIDEGTPHARRRATARLGVFQLDALKTWRVGPSLDIAIGAEGPTRILTVTRAGSRDVQKPRQTGRGHHKGHHPSANVARSKHGSAIADVSPGGRVLRVAPSPWALRSFDASVEVEGVGMSIVDSVELLYMNTGRISVDASDAPGAGRQCVLSIERIQIDNQIHSATFPVILTIGRAPMTSGVATEGHVSVAPGLDSADVSSDPRGRHAKGGIASDLHSRTLAARHRRAAAKGADTARDRGHSAFELVLVAPSPGHLKHVSVRLQPVHLNLDESVLRLVQFARRAEAALAQNDAGGVQCEPGASGGYGGYGGSGRDGNGGGDGAGSGSAGTGSNNGGGGRRRSSNRWYVENLHLHPLRGTVTFRAFGRHASQHEDGLRLAQGLLQSLGTTLAKIEYEQSKKSDSFG